MGKKSKLNWKTVVLDPDLLSKTSIEGLIGIEELSDYSFKKSSSSGGKLITAKNEKASKKKRVKVAGKNEKENNSQTLASNEVTETEVVEKVTQKRKSKKKKKKKRVKVAGKNEKENDSLTPANNEVTETEIVQKVAQKQKSKKKKKKKRVKVAGKNEKENDSLTPANNEVTETEIVQKVAQKRKSTEKDVQNEVDLVPKKLKVDSKGSTASLGDRNNTTNKSKLIKKRKANKAVNVNQNVDSKKSKVLFSSANVPTAGDAIEDSELLSVMAKWNGLFVPQSILKALHELGFKEPTQIQVLSLPAAIKGRKDMMGAAETGSGKTLAFGIPILAGILKAKEISELKKNEESKTSSDEEEDIAEDAEELSVSEEGAQPECKDEERSEEEKISDDNDAENSEDIAEEIDNEEEKMSDDNDAENSEDIAEEIDNKEEKMSDDNDAENSEDSAEEIDIEEEIMSDDNDAANSEDSDEEFDDEEEDEISEKEDELTCVRVIDNVKFPFSLADEKSKPQNTNKLWALVLTPTRELAIQVYKHLIAIAKYTAIKVAVLVGGMAPQKQERMLRRRPEIVVATPGRLWELIQGGNPHLSEVEKIRFLAVDEADRMLEAGHFQELKDLLERINKGGGRRQNFVYSATLSLVHEAPKRMRGKKRRRQTPGQKLHSLAELIGLKDPKIVDVTPEGATAGGLVETRLTSSSLVDRDVRLASLLTHLAHSPFSAGSTSASKTIVFCNSVGGVRRLGGLLSALQLSPFLLHAGMQQRQRLRSLERFSQGGILLATDVAARGLDLPLVDHVIHFQVPRTSETYVHRSGRTARANREGLSVLLVEPKEVQLYERLCRTLGKDDGLPLFPLDEKLVNLVKERVRLAREVDFLEHQLRRTNAEGNWIQKTVKDADIILDDEDVPKKGDMENPQLKKELKIKKKELESLLRKTLLPMGFSPRYPTMNGKLEFPAIGTEAKTVVAVKSKLVDREKKNKLRKKWKKKVKS